LQAGLILAQPVTGFHVDCVHSMLETEPCVQNDRRSGRLSDGRFGLAAAD
jgi:hypothetical protein